MAAMETWQKSSFSGNGPDNDCVEIAAVGDAIAMRESDAPGVVLTATPRALSCLLQGVKEGHSQHAR